MDTVKNIKQIFQNYDWNGVTAESLTNLIENTVINNCKKRDSKDTINKNKEGTTYKSKNKIPRNVRLWMRRKNLASKALES